MHSHQQSATEFCLFWQKATSIKDVAAHFNINEQNARARSRYYRKQGVPLKQIRGTIDFEAIAKKIAG